MKCPKCGYLGFEPVERCRNCGYDFSLSQSMSLPDLPMRHESTEMNPLDDLSLSERAPMRAAPRVTGETGQDLDRLIGVDDPAPSSRRPRSSVPSRPAGPSPSEELSLFGPPLPDDEPLITRPSPPRTPLAVRRATPEAPRLRAEPSRSQSLDLGLELDLSVAAESDGSVARARSTDWDFADAPDAVPAGIVARLCAVAIDLLILLAIDVAVVYFTMQICGVGLWDLAIVPKVPLLAFLLVQNGGYLVAFTVGGQTLGKMAAGIKVISSDAAHAPDIGSAMMRTAIWLVLAVPAGLGFLSAAFSRDHRGLHDRFAGTRVVRASA
jgi:uncharacterized RDD family membrane protein YckC